MMNASNGHGYDFPLSPSSLFFLVGSQHSSSKVRRADDDASFNPKIRDFEYAFDPDVVPVPLRSVAKPAPVPKPSVSRQATLAECFRR